MFVRLLLVLTLALQAAPLSAVALSRADAPTESVWKPADTPPGGVAWSLLESTKEITRTDARGYLLSKPDFPAGVLALKGKKVKVSGYMMPLQNGKTQTHFVLLAYPPDCPFHLNPSPMQFIEVKTDKGVVFDYGVKTIEGVLELGGQDEGGVFYKINKGRAL
ncbi:DUF3299 domain-containing protein [Phenylobacterium sp.]|uniref:DUF3299 domain-containing protein n=1 Tax=Phenylobacterium sp. TaxID=1871053 RepID=UPI0027322AE6|nr:DUF3299 domain-containing protein [Phenylobacterium sp.]MDP1875747.1 DUF3299 domain-containing protein [Phenylobacterium sp.]MDP3488986.1 DUF3299 domain-containing protein [Phenylobacterium sp.]